MSELDRALESIERALRPLEEVRAAVLFGSRATGRTRPDSDVDVAVLLDPGLAPAQPRERLARLFQALATELAAERLDLVILNEAPPALTFQVFKHGRVAFERDPRELHRLRVRAYSQHADYQHVEQLFREATRQRAARGAARG